MGLFFLTAVVLCSSVFPRQAPARAATDLRLEDVRFDLASEPGDSVERLYWEADPLTGGAVADDWAHSSADSSREAPEITDFAELWYEHHIADERLRLRFGKTDPNGEFGSVQAGSDFWQFSPEDGSAAFEQPGLADAGFGTHLFAQLGGGVQLGFGIFDTGDIASSSGRGGLTADFDERLVVGEAGMDWGRRESGAGGRFALGAWKRYGDLARLDGGTEKSAGGQYVLLEQSAWKSGSRGLTLFTRAGTANGAVSEVQQHVAVGGVFQGLFSTRNERTGLMLSYLDVARPAGFAALGSKLAIELFHRVELVPGLDLQPDLQYLFDPSRGGSREAVLVAGLRLELSL